VIDKGEVRVGRLSKGTGTFGNWEKLDCHIPARHFASLEDLLAACWVGDMGAEELARVKATFVDPFAPELSEAERMAPPAAHEAPEDPEALKGTVWVVSGVFDDLGGFGMRKGKEATSSLIQAMGGKVAGAISGKTTHLLVGRLPGERKVADARQRGLPLVSWEGLQALARGGELGLTEVTKFSSGFGGNSIGKKRRRQ
jgi:DNA ligase (NAD+)